MSRFDPLTLFDDSVVSAETSLGLQHAFGEAGLVFLMFSSS